MLLHFYYYDYDLFYKWHLAPIGDRILLSIRATGLFANPFISKILSLVFLALSMLDIRGQKDEKIKMSTSFMVIFVGTIFYFISPYPLFVIVGYTLVLIGGARLSRALQLPWNSNDPFGRRQAGFPQEEQRRENDFSLHLKAQYAYKGNWRDSWINLINPRRESL